MIYKMSGIRHKAGGCFSMHICTVLVGVNVDIGIPTYRNFFRLNVNQAGGLYLFGRCYDYRNTFPPMG